MQGGHQIKWWHSAAKGMMGVVTTADSRVRAELREVCLAQTYGIGYLTVVFLQVKQMGSLSNFYLICISRRVLGQGGKSLT